jgi:alkanesulfonate monooxygenase SsuD/methylene tetrahydromethanopterin reductase-like flavin-dependent oxidoreductase (luciferase family)
VGLGTPRKSIVHPLRRDLPVLLSASVAEDVELAAEIGDGVLIRDLRLASRDAWAQALRAGASRRTEPAPVAGFEVAASCHVDVAEDREGLPGDERVGRPDVTGSREQVAEQLQAWTQVGITCLVVEPTDAAAARRVADVVLSR